MTEAVSHEIEQFERGSVSPVSVLEKKEDRFASREPFKLIQQCRKRLATLLSGAQSKRWIARAKRDREQSSKDGGNRLDPRGTHCKHCFKLVERFVWRVVS